MDPSPFTLRQLYEMARARLAKDWDFGPGMWTNKRNPYRRRSFTPMQPAELYALQRSIERRNARRNGQTSDRR